MWTKIEIESMLESIYDDVLQENEYCKMCKYSEVSVDYEPYGDGYAKRVTEDCTLSGGFDNCPGVQAAIDSMATYIETEGKKV